MLDSAFAGWVVSCTLTTLGADLHILTGLAAADASEAPVLSSASPRSMASRALIDDLIESSKPTERAGVSVRRLRQRLARRPGVSTPSEVGNLHRQSSAYRIAFVFEHIGGHVTFARTVREAAQARHDIDLVPIALDFQPETLLERLPLVRSNWTVRASLRTRRRLMPLLPEIDAVLVHTQTAAQACRRIARSVPLVLSVDATPINYDAIGVHYAHTTAGRSAEFVKRMVTGVAFRRAARIVAWSEWVRTSLIKDYSVSPHRIVLVPGGVSLPQMPVRNVQPQAPVRLLFLGRDFCAKGGEDLLAALEGLDGYELDVVTLSDLDLPSGSGIRVHKGLTPGDPLIQRLLSQADIAVLPTRGDSSPFAVLEAMSHALPVITTRVGAIAEIVRHGESGLLMEPGDVRSLREYLITTLADEQRRRSLGEAARHRIEERYDAAVNADRVLSELVDVACAARAAHGPR